MYTAGVPFLCNVCEVESTGQTDSLIRKEDLGEIKRMAPLYSNKLRACIKQAGYSFREVSRETTIPESTLYDWAAGNRPIPHRERQVLASLLSCDEQNLQPQHDDDMLQLPQDKGLPSLGREMNRKRRELLQLLGFAGNVLLLPLPDIDWGHLEATLTHPSDLDTAMIESLESINNHCWNVFMNAPSKPLVLDGVQGQLKMYLQFLKERQTTQARRRLCALASNMSQLAGEIYFDLHDYVTAQSCYVFAAHAAKEAKAYDLWASTLIRCAYLPLFDEQYEEALPFLQQAEQVAQQGDSLLSTKYWAVATYAEAEAGRENLKACQNALERAQGVHTLTGTNPAWVRFDGSRLPALQGACYVRLKQPQLAEPVLLEALHVLPFYAKAGRRPGMIFSDLAMVALQQKNIDQACSYADKVVDLAAHNSSGFLRDNVQKLQKQLVPFKSTVIVKQLEKRITSLAQSK